MTLNSFRINYPFVTYSGKLLTGQNPLIPLNPNIYLRHLQKVVIGIWSHARQTLIQVCKSLLGKEKPQISFSQL
jgi:hypothetical protein